VGAVVLGSAEVVMGLGEDTVEGGTVSAVGTWVVVACCSGEVQAATTSATRAGHFFTARQGNAAPALSRYLESPANEE
jgi:hypothetical protein